MPKKQQFKDDTEMLYTLRGRRFLEERIPTMKGDSPKYWQRELDTAREAVPDKDCPET